MRKLEYFEGHIKNREHFAGPSPQHYSECFHRSILYGAVNGWLPCCFYDRLDQLLSRPARIVWRNPRPIRSVFVQLRQA